MKDVRSYDLAVVGGAVVGLLSALVLSRLQVKVCLIEKIAKPCVVSGQTNTRVVALNHASVNMLKNLGLWPLIERHGVSPYTNMKVWDYLADGEVEFDSEQMKDFQLGWIVEQKVLLQVLIERLEQEGRVDLFFEQEIEDVDTSCGLISLKGQLSIQASLLIAADGGQSYLREKAGIAVQQKSYHQKAIVATVSCEKPHQQTALQCFHPTGPVALLPMVNSHQISLVWSLDSDDAQEKFACPGALFEKSLANAVEHVLGDMHLETPRVMFPLNRQLAKYYWKERCILVGDAAHVIHPLAGQGLNLGLMDVATLFDALKIWLEAGKIDLPRYLNRYQRQRRSHALILQSAMDAFHYGFKSRNISLLSLRNWGLNRINLTASLKNKMIDVALGRIGFTIPYLGRNHHDNAKQGQAFRSSNPSL